MGKAFEKQIKTIENQGKKQADALKVLKPKATESESNNKPIITQDIYDEVLEERMDEILKMSRKINYSNLVYDFKGPTPSINFTIFGGPMYTYNQLEKGEKTLQQVEEEQKYFLKKFKRNHIWKSEA